MKIYLPIAAIDENVLMLAGDQQMAHRIAEISRLLQETPPEWRERIVHATNSPTLRVTLTPESELVRPIDEEWRSALIRRFLARLVDAEPADVIVNWLEISEAGQYSLAPAPAVWMHSHMAQMMTGQPLEHALKASIRLEDGQGVNFTTVFPESEHLWSSQAILSTALMTIAVALLSLWVVRRMTMPLRAMARASEASVETSTRRLSRQPDLWRFDRQFARSTKCSSVSAVSSTTGRECWRRFPTTSRRRLRSYGCVPNTSRTPGKKRRHWQPWPRWSR